MRLSWFSKSGYQFTGWEGCQKLVSVCWRNSMFNCKSKVVYSPLSAAALIFQILLLLFGTRANATSPSLLLRRRGPPSHPFGPGRDPPRGASVTLSRLPTPLMRKTPGSRWADLVSSFLYTHNPLGLLTGSPAVSNASSCC